MSRIKPLRKVRVLHIIKSLGRGGAEKLLAETLHRHNKSEFEFYYLYFLPWKNQMVEEIELNGGKVFCLQCNNNWQIIFKIGKLIEFIQEHRIQIIHCHLPWAGIVGRISGRLSKIPVIYTEHNIWERYNNVTRIGNTITYKLQEEVIAVSDNVAKSIKASFKSDKPQIRVIKNGVDTIKFNFCRSHKFNRIRKKLNLTKDNFVIGTIAVFRSQKRLHIWLDVAKTLKEKYSNVEFVVVGDGPLRQQLQQIVSKNNMETYVHFEGLQSDIREYLECFDVFMMTSQFEGLPIALLEAMSTGCVPVCTSAGGIGEVIIDNQNGYTVNVNEPCKIVEKISLLVEDKILLSKMEVEASETIKSKFNLETMIVSLERIYNEYCNNK